MNKRIDLKTFGLTDQLKTEASAFTSLYVARVVSQFRDLYRVVTQYGEITARVSGKLRFQARNTSDFPAVGDFVIVDREEAAQGDAIIHSVLTRKSVFIRKAAGTSHDDQVVASNIDTVFLCMSMNNDFNLRRLERYLAVAWDSGAVPVIVLTKADLCEDVEQRVYETESAALGADILVTSSFHDLSEACGQLMNYITPGRTVAFLGSSGVGKSTLINRLLGEEKLDTNGLRNDDKGRHTTTKRELIQLPNGGMVIDTPGMRELGLENVDFSRSFADIDGLAQQCRFNDCTHGREPGCAVQQAIREGILSEERFMNYQKLKKEARKFIKDNDKRRMN